MASIIIMHMVCSADYVCLGLCVLQVRAFGHCRSLKALEEFQACAVPLPSSVAQPICTGISSSTRLCQAGGSCNSTAADFDGGRSLAVGSCPSKPALPVAGSGRSKVVAGPRIPSASAAAAKVAQWGGLQLVGSAAGRTNTAAANQ